MANQDGSAISTAHVYIEAIQTVVSMKPTEPPLIQRMVLNEGDSVKSVAFQQCHQMLLYYTKADVEDSAWVMIGRLKESLGMALLKYPMFTGRVKWGEDADGEKHQQELVMVSNDSGLRLVEAKYPMSMDVFLGRADREQAETELVYWDDLKELDPQFCPLSYVQVTGFECGGYSIGMSLSVLLGDSSTLSEFLKHLTNTHLEIFVKNKPPPSYLPKHKAAKSYPIPSTKTRRKHHGQTLLYHVNAENSDEQDNTFFKKLASSCIKDAEQKLKASSDSDLDFTVIAKNVKTSEVTVGKSEVKDLTWPPQTVNAHPKLNAVKLDDKVFKEATFWEGHKPVHGTSWIGLHDKEGLVTVNMSPLEDDDKAINITVSVP